MHPATAQFRSRLEAVAAATGFDDATGLYALDSEFRRLGISWSTFFGAARALLLQVAHPTVAQGVFEFSDFRRDPVGRGMRTFFSVFLIGLGTQRLAVKIGALVFEKHAPIKGVIPGYAPGMTDRPYSAMEPRANLWVWATLVDGILFGHRELHDHVAPERLAHMYDEAKTFAQFFNVKPELIPPTLSDFAAYVDDVVAHELEITPAGRAVAEALTVGPVFPYREAGQLLRVLAIETLPARTRDAFGWHSTAQTRLLYGALRAAGRAFYAVAPEALKPVPIAYWPRVRKWVADRPLGPGTQALLGRVLSRTSEAILARRPRRAAA